VTRASTLCFNYAILTSLYSLWKPKLNTMLRTSTRNLVLIFLVFSFARTGLTQEALPDNRAGKKSGTDYVAIGMHFNQFKSIDLTLEDLSGSAQFREFPLTAKTFGASITLGTNINENFFTELRYGQGVISDDLSGGAAEVNIDQWFNWYIGGAYGITAYASVYAKYGLTFYTGDITRYETKRFKVGAVPPFGETITVIPAVNESLTEDIFSDSFSTSWLTGVDFNIYQDTYWTFEYGRLLNDNGTGIKVYQFNTALKYEF